MMMLHVTPKVRKNNRPRRPYLKAGRHFRGNVRAAALRAEIGARVVLGLPIAPANPFRAAAQPAPTLSTSMTL